MSDRLLLGTIVTIVLVGACDSAAPAPFAGGTNERDGGGDYGEEPDGSSPSTSPPDASPPDASPPIKPRPVTLKNPVYVMNAADPFVLKVGNMWHAYVTGGNISHLVSTDLETWTRQGDAVPAVNTKWIDPDDPAMWAPSVAMIDETHFVLYYSPHVKGTENRHCLGRATASNPAGPFVDDFAEPLYCDDAMGRHPWSLDPSPFRDASGQLYLLWRQDGENTHIAIRKMGPYGQQFETGSDVKLIVDHTPGSWEDNPTLGKLIENPAMVRHGGSYYVFYSGNSWQTADYATGYAVCTSPLGPCEKKSKTAPWFAKDGDMLGPGGLDFFQGPGTQRWVAWHAWYGKGNVGGGNGTRQLFLGTFEIDANGVPKIGAPVISK